jgi:PAS domain S-box-containing protein
LARREALIRGASDQTERVRIADVTGGPSIDEVLAAISAATAGDPTARVPMPDGPFGDEVSTRLGQAVNRLLDAFAARTRAGETTTRSEAAQDLHERKKAEDQRLRLAALVEASDDAIIGKTLDGIVTSWNDGASRLFGFSADEMIGQSIARLIPPDRQHEERQVLQGLAQGRVERFDTVRVRKDGRTVDVSVTSSPVRDSTGTLVGASKVARDITERRRAELALARARDVAEAASRELESFNYSIAHDLRAPLRAMNGFAHLLLAGHGDKLDEEGRDWLGEIVAGAQKMASLIDALLALSRVTRSEPRRECVDLSSLFRTVADELSAADPGRCLDLVVEDGLTAEVDPTLARALLENLVGNAWKFTTKTSAPRIEFGRTAKNGDNAFFVRDNGAGFDVAFASKLFGPFQRLHSAEEFPGTGIGLATVQRIVHRHGGRVWAEGTVGKGATFYFTCSPQATGYPSESDAKSTTLAFKKSGVPNERDVS